MRHRGTTSSSTRRDVQKDLLTLRVFYRIDRRGSQTNRMTEGADLSFDLQTYIMGRVCSKDYLQINYFGRFRD